MEIIVAKTAGFCFGVDRAVKIAYKSANKDNKTYTYGNIIHNDHVVNDLKNMNVHAIKSLDEIPEGVTVIVRAHGITEEEYENFDFKNIKLIDATCPFVKKIQNIASRESKIGRTVIIVGDKEHPEVKGICGWCKNKPYIVNTSFEAKELIKTDFKHLQDSGISIVAQTTIKQKNFEQIAQIFKKHFTDVNLFDTICDATINRQTEAGEIAKQVDLMIVIGDRNSSNTTKLYEVCLEHCETLKIESAKELNEHKSKIKSKSKIGITAGASTPACIIKEVIFLCKKITEQTK